MKILVVDDEVPVIETIVEFLDDCGHETTCAGDGIEGLRVLESQGPFGLIISDVRMPRMDGLEFLDRVNVEFPGIPVMLITGHGDESLAVAALQQGACDYIKKPIKLREFKACIEKIEERQAVESYILEGAVPTVGRDTSDTDIQALREDIEALQKLWETVEDYLLANPPDDPRSRRHLSFVADEIGGMLRDSGARLDRMGGQQVASAGAGVGEAYQ